jgi:Kdo2-lipid IVA lauroyltransferase/acyltransferase
MVDRIIGDLRHRAMGHNVSVFAKGATGARGALAHLLQGGFLGMLIDQKMSDGIKARLFEPPAMAAPTTVALGWFRWPVIPGYVRRLRPARFRILVEELLPLPDTGDRQTDIRLPTQALNDCLERWIRERPESWLRLHRRFPKEVVPICLPCGT